MLFSRQVCETAPLIGLMGAGVNVMPIGIRVGRDDFLDACAAAWTASRIARGVALRFPEGIDRDAQGLDQAIWF